MTQLPKQLKVILDSPFAITPGHVIKTDDEIERPWAIVSATGGTSGPETGRKMAGELIHRYNAHEQLVAALEEALNRLERVDKIALDATGSVYDGPLGEITRGRAALAAAKKGVTA